MLIVTLTFDFHVRVNEGEAEETGQTLESETKGHETLGFLTGRCRGPRPSVEWGPEPEYSSPVLTCFGDTSEVSQGESVLVSSGGMCMLFPPEL